VLRDGDVSAQHFEIVVDGADWRAQTYSPEQRIVIDRRWAHPRSGKKGALIYAGGTEILVFPGDLDDAAVQGEIQLRAHDDIDPSETEASAERTVAGAPNPLSSQPAMVVVERRALLDQEEERLRAAQIEDDETDLAMLPTLAGDQAPEDIMRMAAETLARHSVPAPSTLRPSQEPTAKPRESEAPRGNAWERASKRNRRHAPSLPPELVAEPESKMAPMPGAERSVFGSVEDSSAWRDERESQPVKRNAWGDPEPDFDPRRALPAPGDPRPKPTESSSPVNAWGDPAERQSRKFPALSQEEVHAHASRASNPHMQARRSTAPGKNGHGPLVGVGNQLSSRDLIAMSADPALAIVREPDGDYATSIRLLGTRLEELVRTFGYRAYMLTSAEPLTGKTTAAINLALALAEDPVRRIALIEANFRHPRIGDILHAGQSQGLIGVLSGQSDVGDAIIKVEDRNLIIFPSGGRHPNPAELLASPRFKTLLNELAETVDVAIIDAPSVKPFADTNLLLPLVDAALMVVLEGATKVTAVSSAVEQLGPDRVLGALYNKVDTETLKLLAGSRDERMDPAKAR